MSNDFPLAKPEIVFRQEGEDALLFDPQTALIKVINTMGGFIWGLCDGKHNIDDILKNIIEVHEVTDKELVKKDLDKFLSDLNSAGLINWIQK